MTAAPRQLVAAPPRTRALSFAGAAFVGSAATVDKYGGHSATGGYLILLLVLTPFAVRGADLLAGRLSPRATTVLAAATFVVLVALVVLVYPHANRHAVGAGSDRDDAADLGARALLDGRYPYAARTYLANPISQFPGGLIFGAPFELAGHTAYAAFFWLPVLFGLLAYLARDRRPALAASWLALALSPVFVRELLTGGDLVANTVAVMLGVVLAARADRRLPTLLGAVVLGVALSWRLSFLFVLPPLALLLARRRGLSSAMAVGAVVAGSFAVVTLPFYLTHLHHFPPFVASDKLVGYNGVIPGGVDLVLAVGLALSLTLALRSRSLDVTAVLTQTAVVEAFFLAAVVVLASARAGSLDLGPLVPGYGLPVLLLALPVLAP